MKFILVLSCFFCLTFASPTTTPEPDPSNDDATTTLPDIEPTTLPAAETDGGDTPSTQEDEAAMAMAPLKGMNADAQKYPGFSRDCTNSNDCQYSNTLVKSTAYLNCATTNRVCICENNRYITDVSIWKLEWNGTACAIAVSGPCGPDNSNGGELVMHCQSGLECVQGRCRDPMKLRQTPLNHSCNEDVDCADGLVCKITAFYFGPSSTCVTPDTPALKGFEEAATGTATTGAGATEDAADSSSTTTTTSSTTITPPAAANGEDTNSKKKE